MKYYLVVLQFGDDSLDMFVINSCNELKGDLDAVSLIQSFLPDRIKNV